SRLAPETGRVSDELLRQLRGRQNFFPMKIRHRHFRRRREKKLLVFEPVHVLLELPQLGRPDHAFPPNEERWAHLEITMLTRMQIEHELDERPFQSRAGTRETDKSAAAQLRCPFQIE